MATQNGNPEQNGSRRPIDSEAPQPASSRPRIESFVSSDLRTGLKIALSGTAAMAVALAVWEIPAEPADAAARRMRIEEEMSATERERLLTLERSFRQRPETEQERLRSLHEQVMAEPQLRQTLLEYENFLASLSVWEQDELRKQTDPSARAARVAMLNTQQDDRDDDHRHPWSRTESQRLSPEALERVWNLLARDLEISKAERDALAEMPPHQRHWKIAEMTRQRFNLPYRNPLPSDETVEEIFAALPDATAAERLKQVPPESRRFIALNILVRGLSSEIFDTASELVSQPELEAQLSEMQAKEGAELTYRSPDDVIRTAIVRILEKRSDENSRELAERLKQASSLREALVGRFRDRRGGPRDDGEFRGPPGPPPDRRGGGPDGRAPMDGRGGPEGRTGPEGRSGRPAFDDDGPFGGGGGLGRSGGPRPNVDSGSEGGRRPDRLPSSGPSGQPPQPPRGSNGDPRPTRNSSPSMAPATNNPPPDSP